MPKVGQTAGGVGSPKPPAPPKYQMTISRLTVDKLGVKLYDRVSAVIAELVANSYDADAKEVTISAPMGEILAEKHQGILKDKGYTIEVKDNGIGMTPEEMNKFYLVVGAERRNDPKRGNKSRILKRKVMGRKGVGKLAPLGICERIEIITSGGVEVKEGKIKGYRTAHIILTRSNMLADTDTPYYPEIGSQDGSLEQKTGTTIRMTMFDHRRVPEAADFDRQLAQRFGVQAADWKIILRDSQKTAGSPEARRTVGAFDVEVKDNTRVEFREELTPKNKSYSPPKFSAYGPDGNIHTSLNAFFEYEGEQYPLTGWVGYSKQPYRDDLMAGVRIYCRGKIAAQTHIFNLKAGFTGEYDIRSYLVGVLNADWLDESEDLIRTDRQDILWSHPLGRAFEEWGQKIVKSIGTLTREPMRKAAWDTFKERTKIQEKVDSAFPSSEQQDIRERTMEIAKTIAKAARSDELEDDAQCQALMDLAMLLGPHISLERKLIEAAGTSKDSPLEVVTDILRTARVAELSSFGRIADDRVKVIKKVEELKDDIATLEDAFQTLIEEAPWLINPQWSPITSNVTLTTMKAEFVKFYKKETGDEIVLSGFDPTSSRKRPDFVLSNQDQVIEIIEIKKPHHALGNKELDRIVKYHDVMEEFLRKKGHEDFLKLFSNFHITLVCDEIGLTGSHKQAFEGIKNKGRMSHMTWSVFLLRTRKMHEAFLKEAERQRLNAAKKP
jgi:hypothetical protein